MFSSSVCMMFAGKLYGNYLITAYLAVKLLYLGNAIGQLFLLDAFLKIDYHLYGVQVVERLIRGQDWGYSERFPRVTLCEFEIRHQSRVHQYVVQCALTINLSHVTRSGLLLATSTDDQSLQREDLPFRLVLVRVRGRHHHCQLHALVVPLALLARSRPVQQQLQQQQQQQILQLLLLLAWSRPVLAQAAARVRRHSA